MANKVHHFGDEYWEPQIDEIDGKLTYSIMVESGHAEKGFNFEIHQKDLLILKSNLYRHAVLYVVLHELLQKTFGTGVKSPRQFLQFEFEQVLSNVLYKTDTELESYIEKFRSEHNLSVKDFVDDFIARKTKTNVPMSKDRIKKMLRSSFARFVCDLGMKSWSRKQLKGAISPRGREHQIEDPNVQGALHELETEGFIRIIGSDEIYVEIVPTANELLKKVKE